MVLANPRSQILTLPCSVKSMLAGFKSLERKKNHVKTKIAWIDLKKGLPVNKFLYVEVRHGDSSVPRNFGSLFPGDRNLLLLYKLSQVSATHPLCHYIHSIVAKTCEIGRAHV